MTDLLLIKAHALQLPLKDETAQCVVTSPPYWGLRDYGLPPSIWIPEDLLDCPYPCEHEWQETESPGGNGDGASFHRNQEHAGRKRGGRQPGFCNQCGAWRGQLGLEPYPELYVRHLVQVFREVRRVLKPDGTLWLNLGDSYATGAGKVGEHPGGGKQGERWKGYRGTRRAVKHEYVNQAMGPLVQPNRMPIPDLKPKDLVGTPWRVAFALQADGWWLRSDIIWSKPNTMPESARDRPTRAHEYIFLLAKSKRYFWDQEAVKEPHGFNRWGGKRNHDASVVNACYGNQVGSTSILRKGQVDSFSGSGRNIRTVWTMVTQPFPGAHFATFPERLVEPCILAGSRSGDIVLDPFGGSGTVARVAIKHNRRAVHCDLSYHELARATRCTNIQRRIFI